ncbi:MAG: hypothetical protein DMF66_08310 [Acidobacteria bacterium]|nr:MAG: hypothetical protein DMF66_08310 [Acidobacteriota bacterium]
MNPVAFGLDLACGDDREAAFQKRQHVVGAAAARYRLRPVRVRSARSDALRAQDQQLIPSSQNLRRIPAHGDEAELPPRVFLQDRDGVQARERDVDATPCDGARGGRRAEAAARSAHAHAPDHGIARRVHDAQLVRVGVDDVEARAVNAHLLRPAPDLQLFDGAEPRVEDAQAVLAEHGDVELAVHEAHGVREVARVHLALYLPVVGVEEREPARDVVSLLVLRREVEDGDVVFVQGSESGGEARDRVLARDCELRVEAIDFPVEAAAHVEVAAGADRRAGEYGVQTHGLLHATRGRVNDR